jgi:hypothetical protein
MAEATIREIMCVNPSTSTDIGQIQALANLVANFAKILPGGQLLSDIVLAVPGVLATIEELNASPDDVYLTTTYPGKLIDSVWPADGKTVSMEANQTEYPQIVIPVFGDTSLYIWDEDFSGDELMGSVLLREDEQGQGEIARVAYNPQEASVYYVKYHID